MPDDLIPSGDESQHPAPPAKVVDDAGPPALRPLALERRQAQPLWSYFVTPAAVILGSIIIAAAVWLADDDGGNGSLLADDSGGSTRQGSQAPTSSPGTPTVIVGSTSPTDVLAAFLGYSGQLGLDQQAFKACLGNSDSAAVVNKHLQRGAQLGVSGTPTFFINNKKIVGAQPSAIFDEVIAAELKGSPTSLDGYSASIKQLAASNPPRFEIVASKVDVSDASIEGSSTAKVMIAEFSDFQCPFCKQWVDTNMKRIRSQLGTDVALAFLHFPIVQIHPNAGKASLAAACAGEQGKFAQMHDILFQKQNEWAKLPSD